MFSTKGLAAFACMAILASTAHAQPRNSVPHAMAASAHMPTAEIDMGDAGASGATPARAPASVPVAAASQPPATAALPSVAPAQPHLSIDDIDRITRTNIARQLAGDNGPQVGIGMNAPPPVAPPGNAPAPVLVVKPVSPRSHAESVRFVGAFSDMNGPSVLYEYHDASYPAHVGTKLLNGWTVKRLDGFVVTVAEGTGKGARTWTETISGGSASQDAPQPTGVSAFGRLTNLGDPLPPGVPLSAIAQ